MNTEDRIRAAELALDAAVDAIHALAETARHDDSVSIESIAAFVADRNALVRKAREYRTRLADRRRS